MSSNNIEVTLLSGEEVKDKSKVLQKIGAGCKKFYWTRDIIVKCFAGVDGVKIVDLAFTRIKT